MTDAALPKTTRDSLIQAAVALFGQKGFAETSTREIAAAAETNVASIAYHFGNKAGLNEACIRHVAGQIATAIGGPVPDTATDPDEAAAQLEVILRRFVGFIAAAPGAADVVTFLLRQLAGPTEAVDLIYDEFLEPRHRALCHLWGQATGLPAESETVKLSVFSMIGQALYFRIGAPYVRKRLDWSEIGADEAARIADLLVANLRCMIERQRT
ncbi:Transcriptional regulator YbiH, TetR family [Rhodovulum sp. P5]|uniref:CerR family C-terminal domain-containing protein n=1 Tax=Rhodovulum sp. P5 TaxID=1564506 RepID=UPI0009C22456|nr:CerR family C-terminal domain-containing protein [Rhodovulum sp. P5]ARE41735.1 Transcriptional regulator YbiH, TetR family [Rhodovulum sp. P5]